MQPTPVHTVEPAYETYGFPGRGPLVVTCEHASNRVPAPLRATESDRIWLSSHWGWDIGARTVARELVRISKSYGVMARFSRLVCDPNRHPSHVHFIRTRVEGTPLSFNRGLDDEEIARRIDTLHRPYHDAVDQALADRKTHQGDVLLLSVHTFTPVWNHRVRTMDVGVLYNPFDALARRLARLLRAEGFETALNQPYSAKDGLAYTAILHGELHNVVYLELEINQSLTCTPARARKVARRIGRALMQLKLRTQAR